MDNPDIAMEEYIELEAEKARSRGQTLNWETATYDKVRYRKNINYFRDFKTDFPAIIYDDALTTDHEKKDINEVNLPRNDVGIEQLDNDIDYNIDT
ncbi:hypothetical protein Tco_1032329 [Tanacetum coccineum]|uniref:Uncharacterized protein n=1 Tax=Tanacetum coccineum TaxID=301880 RepID=A0ABQ5GD81_9ASTR